MITVTIPFVDYKCTQHKREWYPEFKLSSSFRGSVLFEEHVLWVRIKDIPTTIPTDPNPRNQDTSKSFYKPVSGSLRDATDPTFCLKNRGMTHTATKLIKDDKTVTVNFGPGAGQIDGSHTYKIILENREHSPNQIVKMVFFIGLPTAEYELEICKSLNRNNQVADRSLLDKDGVFDWIKELVKDTPYASVISYRENDGGRFSVIDVLRYLTLLDCEEYPGATASVHWVYQAKNGLLKHYTENSEKYEKFNSVFLCEVLELSDIIQSQLPPALAEEKGRRSKLRSYEARRNSFYMYTFTQEKREPRDSFPVCMLRSALFPIFAAFRCLVEVDKDGLADWVIPFSDVRTFVRDVGARLLDETEACLKTDGDHKDNPDGLAKDRSHWASLYKTVEAHANRSIEHVRNRKPVSRIVKKSVSLKKQA
jgi:hypothetical protein